MESRSRRGGNEDCGRPGDDAFIPPGRCRRRPAGPTPSAPHPHGHPSTRRHLIARLCAFRLLADIWAPSAASSSIRVVWRAMRKRGSVLGLEADWRGPSCLQMISPGETKHQANAARASQAGRSATVRWQNHLHAQRTIAGELLLTSDRAKHGGGGLRFGPFQQEIAH